MKPTYKCPKCGSGEIVITPEHLHIRYHADGSWEFEFDPLYLASCVDCEWDGSVGELKQEDKP